MVNLGFNNKLIDLIMHCVSYVSYLVIINGETFGNITPTKGIRQGDPLSLYLFLLYVEGLSALIHEAARNQPISRISICRGCPIITHLFFADDSLLFCKTKAHECQKLVSILKNYEAASGQKIYTDKSSVFFSPNTPIRNKRLHLELTWPNAGLKAQQAPRASFHHQEIKIPSICKNRGEGSKKTCWMEGEASFNQGEGGSYQGSCTSSPSLHNELLLTP